MQYEEEINRSPLMKPAFIHGLIISAILIIISLGFYFAGFTQNRYAGWVSLAITVAGIIYAIYNYRDNYLDGYISYARAVGYGVLVGLAIGIITGIFAFLLYGYISPQLLEEARIEAERRIYRSSPDLGTEERDFVIALQQRFISPTGMLISSIFGSTFQGLLFGLIGGIFARRTRPESFEV
jgi:hypothetical protein